MIQKVVGRIEEGRKTAADAARVLARKNYLDQIHLKQMKALNKQTEAFNVSVGRAVESIEGRLTTIQKLTTGVKKLSIDLAQADFRGAKEAADPFFTKSQKIKIDLVDKTFDIKAQSLEKFRSAITAGTKRNLSAFTKKFADINAKVVGQAAKLGSKEGKEQLGELARNRKAQEAMVPVMEKAFEVWSSAPDDLNAMKHVTDDMAKVLTQNGIKEGQANGAATLLLSEIKASGSKTIDELALAIQQRNHQIALAEKQAYWQEKSAQIQERIASFGGQGEIFGDSGDSGLSKGFDSMVSTLESQIKGAVSNNIVDIGRANAKLMDELMNKMNFDSLRDNLQGLAPLLGSAIAGRAKDIDRQVSFAQRVTSIAQPDLVLPSVDSEKIATKMISEYLLEDIS